jgi:tRNA(Ile2)-agmatinylcytidine synthase
LFQFGQRNDVVFMGQQCKEESFSKQEKEEIFHITKSVVDSFAQLEGRNTNPGFVLTDDRPCEQLYWDAVREIVSLDSVEEILSSCDAMYRKYKNGRGLIGATAAIAWTPLERSTYECISYRKKERWGSVRSIDASSVIDMDEKYPDVFDSYDPENEYVCITPHSPCPVLFGIRGLNPETLISCNEQIGSEEKDGWMVFLSNQASDDHLVSCSIDEVEPFRSVIIEGVVGEKPRVVAGGHVVFSLKSFDGKSCIDCAAYEPTKQFRRIIRELECGDELVVYGGVRSDPLTVNSEKIKVLSLVSLVEKVENPVCSQCGKHMKSVGKDLGFRCRRCGTRSDKPLLRQVDRGIDLGMYEVPVVARRHLSRPLKLLNRD